MIYIFYVLIWVREAFNKKKIESVDFFHTGGRGSTPNPHFKKSVDFPGGMGGLGSNFHTFLSNFIFLKEFCPILSSFCGLEGHFQGEIEENFFSPKCVSTL